MVEQTLSADHDLSLNRVADRASRGETMILTRNGEAVAKIVPLSGKPNRGSELARLWPKLRHLDASAAEAFEADIIEARQALPPLKPAWES